MTFATRRGPDLRARSRRQLGSLAALVALMVTFAAPGLVLAWSDNSFSPADEALLVQLTNQARASAGLVALAVDPTLTDVARWRSRDMVDRNYFSHSIPPANTKVFDELTRIGYCYVSAGENIGTNNFPDDVATQTIQDGFMGSPGHRANILGAWAVIGIGAYKGADGKHVWTILFAISCGSAPAPTQKPPPKPPPPATPKPTAGPTARPTVSATRQPTAPTPDPSVPAQTQNPSLTLGAPGSRPLGLPDGLPDPLASAGTKPAPSESPTPSTGRRLTAPGLQVIETPFAGSLVDTIVGDVAGAYFGH